MARARPRIDPGEQLDQAILQRSGHATILRQRDGEHRAARPTSGRMIGFTYPRNCGHTIMITLTSEVLLSLWSDPI
ncbi:hypothetical protein Xph01_43070 [Micromonospora phaseoli]|nr:hypothetical protein Xph01_43070 [Micromonospora phaseoli]